MPDIFFERLGDCLFFDLVTASLASFLIKLVIDCEVRCHV